MFSEQESGPGGGRARLKEETRGQRMVFSRDPTVHDFLYSSVPPSAWRCLPEVDLFDADSVCGIAAMAPGDRPVFVKFLDSGPGTGNPRFQSEYETESVSIFSLSCPSAELVATEVPPPIC